MARAVKTLCNFCDAKIVAGNSFCSSCDRPTQWATHGERVDWEVRQWRSTHEPTPRAVHAPAPPPRRHRRAEHSLAEHPELRPVRAVAPPAPEPPAAEAPPRRPERIVARTESPPAQAHATPAVSGREFGELADLERRIDAARKARAEAARAESARVRKPLERSEPERPIRPAAGPRVAREAPTEAIPLRRRRPEPTPVAEPRADLDIPTEAVPAPAPAEKPAQTNAEMLQEALGMLRTLSRRMAVLEQRAAKMEVSLNGRVSFWDRVVAAFKQPPR